MTEKFYIIFHRDEFPLQRKFRGLPKMISHQKKHAIFAPGTEITIFYFRARAKKSLFPWYSCIMNTVWNRFVIFLISNEIPPSTQVAIKYLCLMQSIWKRICWKGINRQLDVHSPRLFENFWHVSSWGKWAENVELFGQIKHLTP